MAGVEALTAMIYHERQQEGSMLCAQHALNSLLQGNYFTAPDLAAIARSFDALENDALDPDAQRSTSHNMDDTGFFSVQVMDKALDVWGLHLVRWRSEQMRPYQNSPHKILAFVLNLHQHWFTLRRFGPARADIESDPGEGHWFNLNSSYVAPKWVSRTYLGMFLQQSEQEGYSVFAVVQADPLKPLALPRTEADLAASTLEAPDSQPGHSSSASSSMPGGLPQDEGTGEVVIPDDEDYDINNEDVGLQAALAASLAGEDSSYGQDAYVPRAPVPAPALRPAPAPAPPVSLLHDEMEIDSSGTSRASSTPATAPAPPTSMTASTEADPVAASMARNRQMLERMKRLQEEALRETYEDEVTGRLGAGASGQPSLQPQQRRRTREEEEEEELERAIATSIAEHDAAQSSIDTRGEEEDADADGEDDEEWTPLPGADKENAASSQTQTRISPRLQPSGGAQGPTFAHDAAAGVRTETGEIHRVYDDEDEQLQEALRASLQTMPEGFVHPPSPLPSRPIPSHPSVPEPPSVPQLQPATSSRALTESGTSSILKADEAATTGAESRQIEEGEDIVHGTTPPPPPPAQVDLDEMRKRRLARFGGQGQGQGQEQE